MTKEQAQHPLQGVQRQEVVLNRLARPQKDPLCHGGHVASVRPACYDSGMAPVQSYLLRLSMESRIVQIHYDRFFERRSTKILSYVVMESCKLLD